ncbi:MAG TPA: ribosome maturation factor RimM [Gammaproteobacteria bacterium]|jgi:16S rRNA processing protein RimM|nr:ribosome maturation factor RimM [Gammaproteobacteria bacterium]
MTSSHITIGKIGATHGIRGWVKVHSYTGNQSDILAYSPWYLADNGGWRPVILEGNKPHAAGVIVKFEGIETPEEARLLTGKAIAITRDQLPALKEGDYYWSDLIGLSVSNTQGVQLGTVRYLIETGSNDVLIVKDGKEHAIPFLLKDVILNIDLEKKIILVNWEPL